MPAGSGRYPSGQRGQTVNLLAYAFGGSNPPLPTIVAGAACTAETVGGLSKTHSGGNSSAVERQPSKLGVAGSNPVSRSTMCEPSGGVAVRAEAVRRLRRAVKWPKRAAGTSAARRAVKFRDTGAHVAQTVERVLGKDEVSGSIPDMGSISRVVGAIVDGR